MEQFYLILTPLFIAIAAFVFKFIDSTFGAGYGTILVPLFIVFGYDPLYIIPALLLSEGISGTIAAFYHNKDHNVKFTLNSKDTKIASLLILCSLIGVIATSLISIQLSKEILKLIISVAIIFVGILVFTTLRVRHHFSWFKVAFIGFIASFLKGITGGGYGPIIISGTILSGINPKHGIGISMLAEGITCLAGAISYYFIVGIDVNLSVLLIIGSSLSSPFSAIFVHNTKIRNLKSLIALIIISLGLYNLYKLFF